MILNTMWPMLLDMSRDECKRILRRLELEAYSSMVSALRAQGALSKEKRKLLQDFASILNISLERHRAEVRRAVNDEKLSTIAEHMAGPNTSTEWAIEGRRLIPLMPRLVPQTAFTALANKMANIAAVENAKLPCPAHTVKLKGTDEETASINIQQEEIPRIPQCIPIHVQESNKHNEADETEDRNLKRRRRSASLESTEQSYSPPMQRAKISAIASHEQFQDIQSKEIQTQSHLPDLPQHMTLMVVQQQHNEQRQLIEGEKLPFKEEINSTEVYVGERRTEDVPCTEVSDKLGEYPQDKKEENMQHSPHPKLQSSSQLVPQTQSHTVQLQTPTLSQQLFQQAEIPIKGEDYQQMSVQHMQLDTQTSSQQLRVISNSNINNNSNNSDNSNNNNNTPVKITFSSSNPRTASCNIGTGTTTTITTTTSAPTLQKVIIVQSTGTAGGPGPPSILQRSLSMPVVKSSPVTSVGGINTSSRAASLIISGHSNNSPVTPTTIVTISTNPVNNSHLTATTVSIGGVPTTAYITSPSAIPRIRPKAVQLPSRLRPRAGSIVIPVTPNQLAATTPGVTLKAANVQTTRSGVHLKQENSPGSRVVTVNVSSSSVNSMQTRTVTTSLASKTSTRSTASTKPNVIVVQKGSGGSFSRGITFSAAGRLQGLPASLQEVLTKVVANKTSTSQPAVATFSVQKTGQQGTTTAATNSQSGNVLVLDLSQENINKNTVLADILHASGITGESDNISGVPPAADKIGCKTDTEKCDIDNKCKIQNRDEVTESLSCGNISTRSSSTGTSNGHCPFQEQIIRTKPTNDSKIVEVIGELDPQTGIYSIHPRPTIECAPSVTAIVPTSEGNTDIFDTTQVANNINLDPLNYIDTNLDTGNSSGNIETCFEGPVASDLPTQLESRDQPSVLQETVSAIPETKSDESASVTVEPSHIDTTHMQEFASQKYQKQDILTGYRCMDGQ